MLSLQELFTGGGGKEIDSASKKLLGKGLESRFVILYLHPRTETGKNYCYETHIPAQQ